ncbi:condensation domain-containing protein [Streptomyces sp. MK5]|uniref:condensation domain-containing protein n=1 Tax=Streptomyces sp. MK5 TaxID=3064253 RepID=UPI0027429DCD|nr:condensation domain-containing protein [Streptomyces sp. MK5]
MNWHRSLEDDLLCVVSLPDGVRRGERHVLDLCGHLTASEAERVAARAAIRHRGFSVQLERHAVDHHTLTLTPHDASARDQDPVPELLTEVLLVPPGAEPVPLLGAQRARVRAAVREQDDPGLHVEQVAWRWTGQLDLLRFVAAWQSVVERESVLRTSPDWVGVPRLVVHSHATVDVTRCSGLEKSWSELLEQDRERGFDLHRPALLRLTLLDDPVHGETVSRRSTRILLTYHRALLDERSVHLLLRAFYRAYLSGGVLPGGERRPDLRDHARWLAGRPAVPARAFWAGAASPPATGLSPGRPGKATGERGSARVRRRLRRAQTARLRSWAAEWGLGESSALHLVWALLLYRATGVSGPGRVAFGVHLAGRDIALPGAADVPGLLGCVMPLTVTVDPQAPMQELALELRNAVLDMVAYPWVDDELLRWSGAASPEHGVDTVLVFDSVPEHPRALRGELAAKGIHVEPPSLAGGGTSHDVTLVARHEPDGSLGLTALYDRAALRDVYAARTLAHTVRLLCALADFTDPDTTVAQVLEVLDGTEVPRVAPRPPGAIPPEFAVLRTGEPGADVICLVADGAAAPRAHERFVGRHNGPEHIVEWRCPGPGHTLPAELVEVLGSARLLLCGSGPGALTAYEIAGSAAHGRDVVVVMTGTGSAEAGASALAAGLRSVLAGSR